MKWQPMYRKRHENLSKWLPSRIYYLVEYIIPWVLSIYSFIKHYIPVILTIQLSHMICLDLSHTKNVLYSNNLSIWEKYYIFCTHNYNCYIYITYLLLAFHTHHTLQDCLHLWRYIFGKSRLTPVAAIW